MAHLTYMGKLARIHGPGHLLVCSDLHGNLSDFKRMVHLWEQEEDAALLLLGDLFHGPSATRPQWEALYSHLADYYLDQSVQLFEAFHDLRQRHGPERIASLLGNHDHAHIGGPVVSKFYMDEAAAMEEGMTTPRQQALHDTLHTLPLITTSSTGVVFTHAAAPARDFDAQDLQELNVQGYEDVSLFEMYHIDLLGELLWRRGGTEQEARHFLRQLGQCVEDPCHFTVHGHEIVREGWACDHPYSGNLSSSFGMKRPHKLYLRLDLNQTYHKATDLRPGHELLRLYPPD